MALRKILSADTEAELREFFGGGLSQVGGLRSNYESMVETIQCGGVRRSGAVRMGSDDELIRAVERNRRVRRCLAKMSRDESVAMSIVYGPIPSQLTDGLLRRARDRVGSPTHFGDRETAAVAVAMVRADSPGASQHAVLVNLVQRARGDKRLGYGPSELARHDIEVRRREATLAIRRATERYAAVRARESEPRQMRAMVQRFLDRSTEIRPAPLSTRRPRRIVHAAG